MIEAGLETLRHAGLRGLGLRELARAVGVSASAPYRHFADRKALLEALAASGFERFVAAMAAAREGMPLEEELPAMAMAYIRFAIDNPALFRLMFSAEISPYRDTALKQQAAAAYATIAVAAAREDKAEPAEVAVICWSFVHGLAMLVIDEQILGVAHTDPEPLLRKLTRSFVSDIRAGRRKTG
jgi:AcrR family transcriptional regulator